MSTNANNTPGRVISFSRTFNLIFFVVFILTLISASGALYLSCSNPQDKYQATLQMKLFEQFCFGWHAGFGAIIGLLGGKMSESGK